MTQMLENRRFSPTGLVQANAMLADMAAQGTKAKIDDTWMDYGAGIAWETVLVFSKSLNMWYQALSPVDLDSMNAGLMPRRYDQILESARN